jgi:hypothetical protein
MAVPAAWDEILLATDIGKVMFWNEVDSKKAVIGISDRYVPPTTTAKALHISSSDSPPPTTETTL